MPSSKHALIVAMLSASFTPGEVIPAIGQQPKATSEIRIPVLPSDRYNMVGCDL
jgi:hypothetical protein